MTISSSFCRLHWLTKAAHETVCGLAELNIYNMQRVGRHGNEARAAAPGAAAPSDIIIIIMIISRSKGAASNSPLIHMTSICFAAGAAPTNPNDAYWGCQHSCTQHWQIMSAGRSKYNAAEVSAADFVP